MCARREARVREVLDESPQQVLEGGTQSSELLTEPPLPSEADVVLLVGLVNEISGLREEDIDVRRPSAYAGHTDTTGPATTTYIKPGSEKSPPPSPP